MAWADAFDDVRFVNQADDFHFMAALNREGNDICLPSSKISDQ